MMRERDFWPATGLLADIPSDNFRETLYILLKLGILALVVYLLFFPEAAKKPWTLGDAPQVSEGRTPVFAPVAVLDDGTRVEWSSCVVAAEDKNARKIEVALGFLRGARGGTWDPFDWALGSATHVAIEGGRPVSIEEAVTPAPEGETRPIIVVGTASHENAARDPRHEEARAEERAGRLASLVPQRYPGADLYTLNLGYFQQGAGGREMCAPVASSASERRVVWMVLTQQEPGADLASGVRNALLEAAEVPACNFDARSYSNFEESRFRLWRRCSPQPV